MLLLLPGTPFPSSFHAGSSLSVKSRLKCHLLRGAFPDLSMQSNSFFHFLSYYYYIYFWYIHHALPWMECSSNPELQALGPTGPWLYCSFPCCVNTPALFLRAGQLWTLWPLDWIFQGASASSQPPRGIWLDDRTTYCPFPVSLLRLWPLSSKLLFSEVSFLGKAKQRNSLIQVLPVPLPSALFHTLHKFFLTYVGSCSQSCPGLLWHLPFEPINARLRVITQALTFCFPAPNQKMNRQKSRILFHVAFFCF